MFNNSSVAAVRRAGDCPPYVGADFLSARRVSRTPPPATIYRNPTCLLSGTFHRGEVNALC
nr:MAG TPA: hypothetical protein [Caudoviricetes sp.]